MQEARWKQSDIDEAVPRNMGACMQDLPGDVIAPGCLTCPTFALHESSRSRLSVPDHR